MAERIPQALPAEYVSRVGATVGGIHPRRVDVSSEVDEHGLILAG